MAKKSKFVEIIGVDANTIEKDESFKEAYAFYITLSDEPDNIWRNYLAKWGNALNTMQRKIDVVGDRLRLVFVYGDNIHHSKRQSRKFFRYSCTANLPIIANSGEVEIQKPIIKISIPVGLQPEPPIWTSTTPTALPNHHRNRGIIVWLIIPYTVPVLQEGIEPLKNFPILS